jgi:hypothetical protein
MEKHERAKSKEQRAKEQKSRDLDYTSSAS